MSSRLSVITASTFLSRVVYPLDGSGQDIGIRHEMKMDFGPARNSPATEIGAKGSVLMTLTMGLTESGQNTM
jgi:hypothetical protein